MRLSLSSALAALSIMTAAPALAQEPTNCTPIQFPRGASSATVTGSVGSDEPFPCYTLATGNGQTAAFRFTGNHRNMAFTIYDVVDDRDSYSFKTQARTYKFVVFQESRSLPGPFALALNGQFAAYART